jgi:hypothetical protein
VDIPSSYTIQSYPKILDPDAKVRELINREVNCWNKPLLDEIFLPNEVLAILSIPLSSTNQGDRLIWRGTANGLFSVRSAYHLAKERVEQNQPESSDRGALGRSWRTPWRLRVPNAEKNFMWRACHEILPTKYNLFKQKIVSDPLCPICGLENETSLHILWECSSARDVWSSCGKTLQTSTWAGPTFSHIVKEIFACEEEVIKQFVALVRKIWTRRNSAIFEGKFAHPDVLVHQAKESVTDYESAQVSLRLRALTVEYTRWQAPNPGWIKVNWDAAICKQTGRTSAGVAVCDCGGKLLAVRCTAVPGCMDPLSAEAWAGVQAAKFGVELQITHLYLEGDAQGV